jgi:predicted amidohydrolase
LNVRKGSITSLLTRVIFCDTHPIPSFRKVHLFDIDVPGGIRFKESDTLSAGDSFTFFQTDYGTFGVGICYDLRFPEYSQILSLQKGDIGESENERTRDTERQRETERNANWSSLVKLNRM